MSEQDSSQSIRAGLEALGLLHAQQDVVMQPLTGGVSSDIWLVRLPSGPVCVKRALPQLKVAALWRAPIARNGYEVAWMRTVAALAPNAVPRVIAHDEQRGMFVMQYLDPRDYALWKTRLREGKADAFSAAQVGALLALIHARTAGDSNIAVRFATDDIFYPIRLEPYLVATAAAHPNCAAALEALVEVTLHTKLALVHGDVSPKNILIGPHAPVLLDAECAWYGDPAFDLAFCLNHLLLKCMWNPPAREAYLSCFNALTSAYLSGVDWEPRAQLEKRTARLLPGLLLARIDGKSPVEYITDERQKQCVRRVAKTLLLQPLSSLGAVRRAWRKQTEHW